MVKISIDLPIWLICSADVELNPLKSQEITIQDQQVHRICLSLAVLLIPYAYLLYRYITSLYFIYSKQVLRELDALDITITIISVIRLLLLFLFPIINHQSGLVCMGLLGFCYLIVLLFIYFRFLVEDKRHWVYMLVSTILLIIIYQILINMHKRKIQQITQQNHIVLSVLYPNIMIVLFITAISIRELISIQVALQNRILTSTITIQLKNRRSFMFLTAVSCWISLVMKRFPDIFVPILGVVLFFLISEWLNMAVIYKCVLGRIVKSNDQDEEQSDDGRVSLDNHRRRSNLIVVEMRNYQRN